MCTIGGLSLRLIGGGEIGELDRSEVFALSFV